MLYNYYNKVFKTNIKKSFICGTIKQQYIFFNVGTCRNRIGILKTEYKALQEQFGLNLKKLREDKGYSLRDLASRINMDDSFISKIENGKRNLQLSTIFELAKGLEIDAKDLLDFRIK